MHVMISLFHILFHMIWTYSILSVGLVCVGMCVIVSLLDSKRVFMSLNL